MSMARCRECQAAISRSAKACPQCGAPRPGRGKFEHGMSQFGWGLMRLGCGVAVLGFLFLLTLALLGAL